MIDDTHWYGTNTRNVRFLNIIHLSNYFHIYKQAKQTKNNYLPDSIKRTLHFGPHYR